MPPFETGENILYTARKHWFIFASGAVFLIVFAALPGLFLLSPQIIPAELTAEIRQFFRFDGSFTLLIFFFWSLELLMLWIIFMVLWTDYYLDVWLITNHRVIDIEQSGLFSRRVSTFRFDQIQDVTAEIPGVIATLIDFGTVKIRTASNETFDFRGVAHPNLVKERVMAQHHLVHTGSQISARIGGALQKTV